LGAAKQLSVDDKNVKDLVKDALSEINSKEGHSYE
jgi:hypothetical protein